MLVATHPLFVTSAQFLKILRGLFCVTGLPADDLKRVQQRYLVDIDLLWTSLTLSTTVSTWH